MKHSLAFPIVDASQVGDARRAAARLTADLGLSEQQRGSVALVINELGNNLVKYAKDGQLVVRVIDGDKGAGIEILSLDKGPGIGDTYKWLSDGYSSSGTPGNGLGAVRRLSYDFDIYSVAGLGTAIMCRLGNPPKKTTRPSCRLDFGVVCVPMRGETKCGDSWAVHADEERALVMVVDGLGHGVIAAEAADEAVRIFEKSRDLPSLTILQNADIALRSTRGAVMAIAETRLSDRTVSFTGVGNISGCVTDGSAAQHFVSTNGTLGVVSKPKTFQYEWPAGNVMLLYSDGLLSRWDLERYPGLRNRHPSIIAGVLYQNYSRGRDDVTVLAARLDVV